MVFRKEECKNQKLQKLIGDTESDQNLNKPELIYFFKKMVKIAINGFGRIGRAFFRIAFERKGIDIVAINDLTDTKTIAHLLKYDSVFGLYDKKVEAGNGFIKVGGKKIIVFSEKEPENLPWNKLNVDVLVESSGKFRSRDAAMRHLNAGAKKVLISAPGKNPDVTIVLGVNEKDLKKEHKIISMASCTTNCLAPVVKILNDSYGIKKGYMTTIHAYTGDQNLVDSAHKDLRRARASAVNLVPTSSGAAVSVAEVIPSLKGKLDGLAVRAPVLCGSITDFVCVLKKSVSVEEVNNAIKQGSLKMKGILEYSDDDIVSSDIVKNSHSSIFDSKLTKVNGDFVKVFSWYDNEWGYSNRMVDFLSYLK